MDPFIMGRFSKNNLVVNFFLSENSMATTVQSTA